MIWLLHNYLYRNVMHYPRAKKFVFIHLHQRRNIIMDTKNYNAYILACRLDTDLNYSVSRTWKLPICCMIQSGITYPGFLSPAIEYCWLELSVSTSRNTFWIRQVYGLLQTKSNDPSNCMMIIVLIF